MYFPYVLCHFAMLVKCIGNYGVPNSNFVMLTVLRIFHSLRMNRCDYYFTFQVMVQSILEQNQKGCFSDSVF